MDYSTYPETLLDIQGLPVRLSKLEVHRSLRGPLGGMLGYGCVYVDEHDCPVERTKEEYPYSYSGFVLHRLAPNQDATGTVYTDRLYQWDAKKHDRLCEKYFGDTGQYWQNREPGSIEGFLREYLGIPGLRLVLVMEYCNVSSGYPVWRLDYSDKPVKQKETL